MKYDAIIGTKGVDDFLIKFPDGRIVPWPTEEQIEEWERMFPMPSQEEIDRIKNEAEEYIKRKRNSTTKH